MNLARRRFLFCAPAIIAAPQLMKLSALVVEPVRPIPYPEMEFSTRTLVEMMHELQQQSIEAMKRLTMVPTRLLVAPEHEAQAIQIWRSVYGIEPTSHAAGCLCSSCCSLVATAANAARSGAPRAALYGNEGGRDREHGTSDRRTLFGLPTLPLDRRTDPA